LRIFCNAKEKAMRMRAYYNEIDPLKAEIIRKPSKQAQLHRGM